MADSITISNNILFDMDLGDTQEFTLTVTDDCTAESFDQSVEISLIQSISASSINTIFFPICWNGRFSFS